MAHSRVAVPEVTIAAHDFKKTSEDFFWTTLMFLSTRDCIFCLESPGVIFSIKFRLGFFSFSTWDALFNKGKCFFISWDLLPGKRAIVWELSALPFVSIFLNWSINGCPKNSTFKLYFLNQLTSKGKTTIRLSIYFLIK